MASTSDKPITAISAEVEATQKNPESAIAVLLNSPLSVVMQASSIINSLDDVETKRWILNHACSKALQQGRIFCALALIHSGAEAKKSDVQAAHSFFQARGYSYAEQLVLSLEVQPQKEIKLDI